MTTAPDQGHALPPDFTQRSLELDGISKTVYVSGEGPAVVLLPEMPGISPDLIRLARWIRDAGLTVYLPSLFGVDGALPTTEAGEQVMRRACVSAEFRVFAGGGTSPVVAWLRALARQAHEECGGPGVGAVGLCFTGNFALTMALEPAVIAPVVNHPSLPLDDPGGLEMSAGDAAAVRERVGRDGDVVGTPHSVTTAHLVDEEGHPTLEARDEIIAFLTARLHLGRPGDGSEEAPTAGPCPWPTASPVVSPR